MLQPAAPTSLAEWQNFYVIVGSSAGALTGLQFVVIALVAQARAANSMLEIRAFGTPTVVHFCAALLISAIGTAPWRFLSSAGLALGVCGISGAAYAVMIIRHARRQSGYVPDGEDWLWYVGLPLVAYVALLAAAALLAWRPSPALFIVAGSALLLLFVGIHNAWDTVTYIAVKHSRPSKQGGDKA